jgi:hypothetical protein
MGIRRNNSLEARKAAYETVSDHFLKLLNLGGGTVDDMDGDAATTTTTTTTPTLYGRVTRYCILLSINNKNNNNSNDSNTSSPRRKSSAKQHIPSWVQPFYDAEAELAACNGVATKSALHVIVIDKIDAVFRKRSSAEDSGEATRSSTVNQILAELDGVESIPKVLLIEMTNRRELLDEVL